MPSVAGAPIGTFVHLKTKPRADEALALLRRVSQHVTPIMVERRWHVRTLAEFLPSQSNLLGTNYGRGHKISLRLRPHTHDGEFLPFEDIVGTMLHELCHIVHGPHDAAFYALLDDLSIKYASLPASLLDGEKVGGGGRKVSLLEAKRLAVQASQNRARGTGPGGVLLGSSSLSLASGVRSDGDRERKDKETRRELAARAATRRAHDARWCGHGKAEDPILLDDEEEQEEVVENVNEDPPPSLRQVKEETGGIIEISSDDESDRTVTPVPRKRQRSKKGDDKDGSEEEEEDYRRMKARGLLRDTLAEHLEKMRSTTLSSSVTTPVTSCLVDGDWTCVICTLANPLSRESCSACLTDRPHTGSLTREGYWPCHACGTFNLLDYWMCRACQTIKSAS